MIADSKLPPPITPGQVKLIHVMLGKQGIDDDWYRELLEDLYGVDTCKKLTRKQANELLTRLGAGQKPKAAKPAKPTQPKAAKPAPRRRDGNVAALATPPPTSADPRPDPGSQMADAPTGRGIRRLAAKQPVPGQGAHHDRSRQGHPRTEGPESPSAREPSPLAVT